jgi:hypothetical protein
MAKSCFICEVPALNTVVHLGIKTMEAKDLDAEMAAGTPFGLKLREIAQKVEMLE